MLAIELRGARKSYGRLIVFEGLDISFEENLITILYGRSGVGKTTLLKCITLLEKLDTGTVNILGKEVLSGGVIKDEVWIRKNVGIVFQDFYLWDNKKVLNNITEALVYVKGMDVRQAEQLASQTAREFNITEDLFLKYPPELSRGQRQRVAIVRTLVMDPEVLLFDEPTASLDEYLVSQFGDILRLLKKKGKTMVVVTHDNKFANQFGDVTLDFAKQLKK